MKRRMGWLTSLLAMSMITGCASSPAVHQATFLRHEPTRVRSLLIVVDDTLFVEASREGDGARFARTLGSTLKNAAGSIPVTLLLIDSESDAKALPQTILSSHATQIMVIKATRITTYSQGAAKAVWQLTISDVNATPLPDAMHPSKPGTRIVTQAFYRDEVDAIVNRPLDIFVGGLDSNALAMGTAIADRLRADHPLMLEDSPASVQPPTPVPSPG